MQYKTSGIILHLTKYSDSSNIVTVYTSLAGKASYMVFGVNKRKSNIKSALFQPLSLVEIDVFHHQSKELQRIKDVRMKIQLNGISSDPVKNALALFVAEILFRTLNHSDADENLYMFLENSVQLLDCCNDGLANFHLVFMLKLSKYLGFEPNFTNKHFNFFDLIDGQFVENQPSHSHYLSSQIAKDLQSVFSTDYLHMNEVVLNRFRRNALLNGIVDYYRLHIPGFHGLNSLSVFQTLFE